tara:strand:- start:2181 stop:2432 length:252 start_codon:yes stop_codon:yes gene_type:complete
LKGTLPKEVVHSFFNGSIKVDSIYKTAPRLTTKKRGLVEANESITPDSSGRGSRTNSGSESSGAELPAILGARRIGFFNVALP